MWECGRRIYICADRWVEKILQYSYVTVAKYTMFEVIVKWPGKMGAQTTTKTGTEFEEKGDVSIAWSIIDVFEVEEQ